MKKQLTIISFTLISCFLFSFGYLQDWFNYVSKEGNYKIQFPASPKEQTQTVASAVGDLTMYIALVESEDEQAANLLYMSAYCAYPGDKVNSDNPKETLDKFFKGAAEGAAKKINGEIRSFKEISYKGFPGRELLIDANLAGMDFAVKQKLILVKNKFYMVQTFTRKEMETNTESTKFFDSFGLVD